MALAILFAAGAVAILGVIVALGMFLVQRVRAGEPLSFSFRTIVLGYFYLMTIVSFLVFLYGLSVGVKVLLAGPFGRGFSYYLPTAAQIPPLEAPPGAQRPENAPVDVQERQRRDVERQYQNDAIQAGTLSVVGGLLWAMHAFGRARIIAADRGMAAFLGKANLTVLLVILGLVSVFSLPIGVYELLRYLVVPPDPLLSPQPPGASIAAAIVFTPAWIVYLFRVLRRTEEEA